MRPRSAIGPAPIRGDVRALLPPLAVPSIDDDLHGGIAAEVVLEVTRQLRVAPRHDAQEAIRWSRQGRGTPTDRIARRGIREHYRTRSSHQRTYSEIDRA